MDLLDQGRTSTAEHAIAAEGRCDEMVAQKSATRGEAGRGHSRHPATIQGNVGEGRRDRSKVVVSEVLERHCPGRDDSGWARICDRGNKCERLAHDYAAQVRHARRKSDADPVQVAERKEGATVKCIDDSIRANDGRDVRFSYARVKCYALGKRIGSQVPAVDMAVLA